ncbi:MAG TPA: hypothetical protein VF996_02475 [Candidatus Saccharimonadales bacterium]|jgi:hypothetical protein
MAIGLGSLKKKADTKGKQSGKKDSNKDEAAEMLKKMDTKAADGDCPFC